MPLFTPLRHAPPAPTAAGDLSRRRRRLAVTLNSPVKVHSFPRPLTGHSPRLAAPARRYLGTGISSSRCRAAADASSSEIPASGGGDRAPWGLILRAGEVLSLGFPVWVASVCALALWRPPAFLWGGPTARMVGLSFTMLGMGMTLTLDNLKTALLMPKELAVGFLLQYTVMPLSGVLVSKLLKLPSHYAAGLILVSCCPGGTASNIVTYLARANVALSVLMTAASTFAAAFMTPLLTSKLAGQYVAVDPMGLFVSTSQVVLAPVLLGALLNQYCNGLVQLVSPLMPFIAVATVAVLCGNAIAQNASAILASGVQVVLPVCCLHALGFFFGYVLSRLLGIDTASSRTISIEVGMQNSVLGVVLASKHFENPLTAVPCAVSSVCHSVYGTMCWRSHCSWRSHCTGHFRNLSFSFSVLKDLCHWSRTFGSPVVVPSEAAFSHVNCTIRRIYAPYNIKAESNRGFMVH